MASTRNNNSRSDYCLQQRQFNLACHYNTNEIYGRAKEPAFASLGMTPTYMASETLSHNAVDIESSLRGIGSTNLAFDTPEIVPQLKKLPEKSFFDRVPLIMPRDLVVEKNQRPFPIG